MEHAMNDNQIQEPKIDGTSDGRDSGIGSSPLSSRESTLSGASNSPAHGIEEDGDKLETHPVPGVNNMENSTSGAISRASTEDERDQVETREEHDEMGEQAREEGSGEDTSEESSDEDNWVDITDEEDESLDDEGSSVDPENYTIPANIYNEAQEYNNQRSTERRGDNGARGGNAQRGDGLQRSDDGKHYSFERRYKGKPPKAVGNPEEEPDEEYFVKDQKGHNHTIKLKKGAKVDDLMEEVYRKTGIPVDQQRLQTDMGQNLLLGATLGATGFLAGATAFLTGRLRGGVTSFEY